jgi:hypothetical protein
VPETTTVLLQLLRCSAAIQSVESSELLETKKHKIGAGCGTRTHDLGIESQELLFGFKRFPSFTDH